MSDRDDQQHLLLLTIFHYVAAGLTALVACIPFIHLFIGLAMVLGAFDEGQGDPPPPFVGWVFMGVAVVMIGLGWVMAVLMLLAGRSLQRRRRWLFCVVVAGIECVFFPIGTVLGVLSIIVLVRPTVRSRFEGQPAVEGA